VSGPVSLTPSHPGIEYVPVRTAKEMLAECLRHFERTDGAVLSAAVSDFRPKSPVAYKIKRKDENLILELEPNPDIAATLGSIKRKNQFLAGFALETDNELQHAQAKLKKRTLILSYSIL
jgi:phosphopantothenoylcysteine decarboxylase/phosphopantothenate--cysteine ligase